MISIIIPAYNAERTIGRCLESIFAQTYREFKVIVVDDGSTDHTVEIVRSATERRDRSPLGGGQSVKLIQQENRGAQAARNRGYQEVTRYTLHVTRYVLFCDADVVLRKDCLGKMVQALEKHPEASYAYSSFKFGWKTFKLWPFDAARLQQIPYIHTTSLIRYPVIEQLMSSAGRYTFSRSRKSVTDGDRKMHVTEVDPPGSRSGRINLTRSGPFDESVKRLQDWDLWLTLLEQGHTGIWIPEVLFRVINTKGTMSQWLPSFAYKIPKWLGIQHKAVSRYNEAVARIKAKHRLP